MKTIFFSILSGFTILLHNCCPSADDIRQLEEQFKTRQDSIKKVQLIDSTISKK